MPKNTSKSIPKSLPLRRLPQGHGAITAPPATHLLATPRGSFEYTLTRKKIRNLNLRVQPGGQVTVSAPTRMPMREIEAFLLAKAQWVLANRQKMLHTTPLAPATHSREECMALFTRLSDAMFPLFSDLLGGRKPALKLREMKTRWGVCNVQKRTITLNTRLADKPLPAIEYVILHEYVHFLHPNHQAGFHAEMARLMPDYKQRRRLLRD